MASVRGSNGRFSDKTARLKKQMKFDPRLDKPIDLSRVSMAMIRPWAQEKLTALMGGIEDEVVVEYALNEMEKGDSRTFDGKDMQIALVPFIGEKGARTFMRELVDLLTEDSPALATDKREAAKKVIDQIVSGGGRGTDAATGSANQRPSIPPPPPTVARESSAHNHQLQPIPSTGRVPPQRDSSSLAPSAGRKRWDQPPPARTAAAAAVDRCASSRADEQVSGRSDPVRHRDATASAWRTSDHTRLRSPDRRHYEERGRDRSVDRGGHRRCRSRSRSRDDGCARSRDRRMRRREPPGPPPDLEEERRRGRMY